MSTPAARMTGVASRKASGGILRRGLGARLPAAYRGAPHGLGDEQDQPVDEQRDRRGEGLGEQDPEGVLAHDAGQADRDGREDDHPGEPPVLVRHVQPEPPVLQAEPNACR